jgi:hypothetical protein
MSQWQWIFTVVCVLYGWMCACIALLVVIVGFFVRATWVDFQAMKQDIIDIKKKY